MLAEKVIEFGIRGDDGALSIHHEHAFIAGSEQALEGGEGLAQEAFGIEEALGGLAGVLLGGVERLALLGKDHVDVTAQLPEICGQPFGGLGIRWHATEDSGGAFHDCGSRFEQPAGDQVGGQEHATTEQDAGDAEEPVEGLAHHAGGSYGWQEAKKPEREQDAESQGVHDVRGGMVEGGLERKSQLAGWVAVGELRLARRYMQCSTAELRWVSSQVSISLRNEAMPACTD